MNKIIVMFLLLFPVAIFAQDKVILNKGDTLNVKITKSSNDLIEFYYPNEETINELHKHSISSIIYSSGRIEYIERKLGSINIKGPEDWEKVVTTHSIDDVKGMKRVKEVSKSSGWGGALGSNMGYNDCIKKLKKEAAKNLCSVVLIVDNPSKSSAARGGGVKLVGALYK